MKPIAVTVPQACQMLSIGKTTAFALIAAGELEGLLIGRRRLITVSSIEALVARAAEKARR